MASDTDKALRRQVMYCVYVRAFSPEGSFNGVRAQLERIRNLGVDVLWLMPIHPIGHVRRKGSLGSPYAISDYRAVNPEYGTLQDFEALVRDAHALGMKVIIDVVYNHTSPDSVLAGSHPEWFWRNEKGGMGNRIGDWSDIVDLDYRQMPLWDYQIETLKMWAELVDGFRCDVAPLVPLAFWEKARRAVAGVRPDCLWLAESVEPEFIRHVRARGMTGLSDGELYRAFDLCYDYDVYGDFLACLTGRESLERYVEQLMQQEVMYPENYVKLRFLENHDRARAACILPDARSRRNWLALTWLQRGMPLLYNGQEYGCAHRPSLFEKEPIEPGKGEDISDLLRRLYAIRQVMPVEGAYGLKPAGNGALVLDSRDESARLVAVFSTRGVPCTVELPLPDGRYRDLIGQRDVTVECGLYACDGEPVALMPR